MFLVEFSSKVTKCPSRSSCTALQLYLFCSTVAEGGSEELYSEQTISRKPGSKTSHTLENWGQLTGRLIFPEVFWPPPLRWGDREARWSRQTSAWRHRPPAWPRPTRFRSSWRPCRVIWDRFEQRGSGSASGTGASSPWSRFWRKKEVDHWISMQQMTQGRIWLAAANSATIGLAEI